MVSGVDSSPLVTPGLSAGNSTQLCSFKEEKLLVLGENLLLYEPCYNGRMLNIIGYVWRFANGYSELGLHPILGISPGARIIQVPQSVLISIASLVSSKVV
jgi:hypothetical protein